MKAALYKIVIGYHKGQAHSDLYRERQVIARHATHAIQKILLDRHEFINEVRFIGRET
jgi:hypothetical protein